MKFLGTPEQAPTGFTALIVAIVFSSGVQLVILGVLGEYVGRIYAEVKARPHYVLERVIRHREKSAVCDEQTHG